MLCCTVLCCTVLYCAVIYCLCCTLLYCAVLYCTVLCCAVLYCTLSHALKNTANQRPGLPLHILRYATGGIPLYFPVIPCAQQLTGVHLRTSQKRAPKPFNSCEPLRTFPITSGNRFRRFPKIFRKFESHKNI